MDMENKPGEEMIFHFILIKAFFFSFSFVFFKEIINSLIKILYDIYNRVTIDQIHKNFNQTNFYIEKFHNY